LQRPQERQKRELPVVYTSVYAVEQEVAIHGGIGSRAWHLIVSVFAAPRSFLALLLAVIG
jgi:hypothetical protein